MSNALQPSSAGHSSHYEDAHGNGALIQHARGSYRSVGFDPKRSGIETATRDLYGVGAARRSVLFSQQMEEQSGIDRERRMMESGRYEPPDLSFLEDWFSHNPAALKFVAKMMSRAGEGSGEVSESLRTTPSQSETIDAERRR